MRIEILGLLSSPLMNSFEIIIANISVTILKPNVKLFFE